VLAGRVEDPASAVVRRAQAPPLAGRVEMPGYVDEASKRALFDRALVFVLPSHTEGFGMPVVPACRWSWPTVAPCRKPWGTPARESTLTTPGNWRTC
jgi:glycosyltransferase involved in cell wall biosynthesis